jgi:hypothetical protein
LGLPCCNLFLLPIGSISKRAFHVSSSSTGVKATNLLETLPRHRLTKLACCPLRGLFVVELGILDIFWNSSNSDPDVEGSLTSHAVDVGGDADAEDGGWKFQYH